MRGGSTLPALTPSSPPQPISISWSLSNTSTVSPRSRTELDGQVRQLRRTQVVVRRVGEIAGEHRRRGEHAAELGAGLDLGRLRLGGDERQRRDRLSLRLGPQCVVGVSRRAARPRRSPAPRPRPRRRRHRGRRWRAIGECRTHDRTRHLRREAVAAVASSGAPMPTTARGAPSADGSTCVEPTSALKPSASSVSRSRPRSPGTSPTDPTGTPTSSAALGTDVAASTVMANDPASDGAGANVSAAGLIGVLLLGSRCHLVGDDMTLSRSQRWT